MDARIGSRHAEEHVKNLEKLVKKRAQSTDDSSTFISVGFPAVILDVWYRLNGLQEDANACFRPWIEEAIQILSDDDPDNDMEVLLKLWKVLFAAGDDKNSIAIMHYLGGYRDHERIESAVKGKDNGTDEEDDRPLACDGPCHRSFPNFNNIHICRYCVDFRFCEDCMQLLKSGAMPLNVCSQRLEWLFVPPLRQKVEREKLLIDGAQVDFKDFLNDLKRQWQI